MERNLPLAHSSTLISLLHIILEVIQFVAGHDQRKGGQ